MKPLYALIALTLLPLSACENLGDKQRTIFGTNVPGLSDMWAPTKEEKEDDKWWDQYYGHKHVDE